MTIRNILKNYTDETIRDLIANKSVKLRKVSRLDYDKHAPTPFFEFLVEIGVFDEDKKNAVIKELVNYEKVKEGIEQVEKLGE